MMWAPNCYFDHKNNVQKYRENAVHMEGGSVVGAGMVQEVEEEGHLMPASLSNSSPNYRVGPGNDTTMNPCLSRIFWKAI